jgi:hypothetical protein
MELLYKFWLRVFAPAESSSHFYLAIAKKRQMGKAVRIGSVQPDIVNGRLLLRGLWHAEKQKLELQLKRVLFLFFAAVFALP